MNRAVPGQKHIPAADWNELRDFMNSYTPQNGGMVNNPLNPFFVYVQNDTSDDLPAFSVVRLDGTIYPQRSAADTKDAALNQLLEISGDTPTGELNENIGILQEDVEAGQLGRAIVVGAALCYVQVDNANTAYKYAKSIDSVEKLKATNDIGQARIVWKESGTGKKLAYVVLDQSGAEPEFFYINYGNDGTQTATDTPTIFTKGSLHYISYQNGVWKPSSYNEASSSSTLLKRPDGARLVICQEDAPDSSKEFKMPYFTPESNMGVPADFSSSISFFSANRCGVKPGEHEFTDKMCDYSVVGGSYEYNPQFTAIVTVDGATGGAHDVYADICGNNWLVNFPNSYAGLSMTNFPDVYPGDQITVLIDCESQQCYAVDYPTDYETGQVQAFHDTPGRGWTSYTTPQALSDVGLTLYIKDKNNAIL